MTLIRRVRCPECGQTVATTQAGEVPRLALHSVDDGHRLGGRFCHGTGMPTRMAHERNTRQAMP